MEWQPIETAPKNNSARLVWEPDRRCTFCVSWREGVGWGIFGGSWDDVVPAPTHWMPLPEPPKGGA